MQNDDVIWQIINHQFCSFKSKIAKERTFCQNPYNVTGLCIRSACPLANSRYATIREEDGDCYLYMKTIERAHTPKNLWEKIKLPSNYTKALEIVSTELEHFPKYLVHRNKQRLTKIHQMLIRMRKLKLRAAPKIVTTNTKIEQREKGKERKALIAAKLDKAIEAELLERLKQATEGEIFNYPERQYNKVLNRATDKFQTESGEQIEDPDLEDAEEELEEEEEELEEEDVEEYNIEYIEDFEESEDEEEVDMEDQLSNNNSIAASSSILKSSNRSNKASASNTISNKKKISFDTSSSSTMNQIKTNKSNFNPQNTNTSSSSSSLMNNKRKARVEIEYEEEEFENKLTEIELNKHQHNISTSIGINHQPIRKGNNSTGSNNRAKKGSSSML